MEFDSSDLGTRDLGIVLSAHSMDGAEPNSAEGRARYVLNGVVESYKAFLSNMIRIETDYGLPSVPAKFTPIAQALQDLEKRLNNASEILKTDVMSLRDRLGAEIAVKVPEGLQNSPADAIDRQTWLYQFVMRTGMGEGSHLDRQGIALKALNLGSEIAHRSLKYCCPEFQEWLLGDRDWFKGWEEKWLLSKQNPMKRARLAALNHLIAHCEEKIALTMAIGRKRSGQVASPEESMRERILQGT